MSGHSTAIDQKPNMHVQRYRVQRQQSITAEQCLSGCDLDLLTPQAIPGVVHACAIYTIKVLIMIICLLTVVPSAQGQLADSHRIQLLQCNPEYDSQLWTGNLYQC